MVLTAEITHLFSINDKEALVILSRIPCAAVRPPLVKIEDAEIARIRAALEKAGVGREGAVAEAA